MLIEEQARRSVQVVVLQEITFYSLEECNGISQEDIVALTD